MNKTMDHVKGNTCIQSSLTELPERMHHIEDKACTPWKKLLGNVKKKLYQMARAKNSNTHAFVVRFLLCQALNV